MLIRLSSSQVLFASVTSQMWTINVCLFSRQVHQTSEHFTLLSLLHFFHFIWRRKGPNLLILRQMSLDTRSSLTSGLSFNQTLSPTMKVCNPVILCATELPSCLT
uniref:Uncharacterized protein n=1 Tax=Opuntia streptacantha TaxID=393608 RepID=A0A7C9DIU3_OPUST